MVSLKAIQTANKSLSSKTLTAVFVGATSGIGLGAIEALLENTESSRIFIIGRSEAKFAATLARLQSLNPSATLTFIEAQVSLLNEVDRVCALIKDQKASLDLLWLSQGGLGLREGQAYTSEGPPTDYAVVHLSRILFMQKLAPSLSKSSDGRVVSVLCAGYEGPVNVSDPGLQDPKNYTSFFGAQKHFVTMQSMAMAEMARLHPSISFIHTNPGMVSTPVHEKWADTMTGIYTPLGWLIRWVMIPLMHSIAYTSSQAGQIGLYEATNEKFSSHGGRNVFRLWQDAEDSGKDGQAVLAKYEADGTQKKIWEHTLRQLDEILAQTT